MIGHTSRSTSIYRMTDACAWACRELRHVCVEDGGTITVKAGSIKTLVDAKWGPANLPLSECVDVTEIVRVLVVKGGVGPVPVSESLFSTPLAQVRSTLCFQTLNPQTFNPKPLNRSTLCFQTLKP